MLKMSSQMENIVNAYKTLAKIPSVLSGRINKATNRVTAKWTVRNLDRGKSSKFVSDYVLDEKFNVVSGSEFGVDVSTELLSKVSPKETFKALIREEKDAKDVKKQYLEVWSGSHLAHSVDLTALELHGDVYADSEFGSLDWSADESSIVYIAERKLPKSEPYIKRKPAKVEGKPEEGSGDKPVVTGEEFIYKQDWGEQLVGKCLSVVVVCRIQTETFSVLAGLPESWCPGQVCFYDNSSVVGVAWETEPRRLGLIFCTNRPSTLFKLTLDGQLTKLSAAGLSVRSPRVRDGVIAYLQRRSDGPHHAAHQLVIIDDKNEKKVLIDTSVSQTTKGQDFYGIYSLGLPARCWSADGTGVLFSTPQKCQIRSYVVQISSGKITDISNITGSTTVLDVNNDRVLAVCSSANRANELYIARLPIGPEETQWVRISEPITLPEIVANSTVEFMDLEHKDSDDPVRTFTAIYTSPLVSSHLPLVVCPHGGPHSAFVDSFSLETAFFTMLGFGYLRVNYRGGTGYGQDSVNFLPGKVGVTDVRDCMFAIKQAIALYPIDQSKVCLTGGSHGGFLVTHLIGQYPDYFRSCVSRNPVTDISSMFGTTDIADWLRVNYRGSTGASDQSVRSLIGNVGRYDVDDCLFALTHTLEKDKRVDSCFLYGGSYGGFVVGHLAGRFPERFLAMVMRNPLIDLATKGSIADNSDGCAVEAGFSFTEAGPVSEEELLAMRRASPIAHVHKVKTPTALMLGVGDKRVPHYQGLEYARRLKANGVVTRIYMYDDNHSLSSQPAEMDSLINSVAWFLEHLE